ncbi:MAG TPA: rhodanese-like domain-containing protein [Cellvibrio sp.]|nr:rhodanese-like domain-containing protein [Cellvibrio sp.]
MNFFDFIAQEWILVSALAGLIVVYLWTEKIKSGLPVSSHELTTLVNVHKAVILDIRPAAEFKLGHLVDAINIPYERINNDIALLEKHKASTIVIVDKLGQHAGQVGRNLKKQGFDIRRLSGGISEWQSQNLPLVKGK